MKVRGSGMPAKSEEMWARSKNRISTYISLDLLLAHC